MSEPQPGPSNIDRRIITAWTRALPGDAPAALRAALLAHEINVSSRGNVIGVPPTTEEMIRRIEDLTGISRLPANLERRDRDIEDA